MRLAATYSIRCPSGEIDRKASALAIEQSVEMPVDAIADPYVLSDIVGRVENIADQATGGYSVRISLAVDTTGGEPGQLMNMLFGNSSLHDDVTLEDVELPAETVSAFCGPAAGLAGLRDRVAADGRALTCAAIKPQGLSAEALAELVYQFALGGIDIIKDDHGLADQGYSPFAERVKRCAGAIHKAARETGRRPRYAPSLSGHLDQLRQQVSIARAEGLDTLLIAPMIVGFPAFHQLASENRDMAFLAHPAFGGAARIAPPLLLGKLFRLFGADAVIFPNFGGRFGYSEQICTGIANAARAPWDGVRPAMPVPAGGMTLDRIGEMITSYETDVMILIGGSLLAARENLTQESRRFADEVARASRDRP